MRITAFVSPKEGFLTCGTHPGTLSVANFVAIFYGKNTAFIVFSAVSVVLKKR